MKARRSCVGTLLICAACALLCACGAGQAHPAGDAASASSGVAHDAASAVSSGGDAVASRAPTRPQALAFAHAVNLSASDIPEASVEAKRASASDASERREDRSCERFVGSSATHKLAEASSPKIKRGEELEIERITSTVTVLSDERAVARQFALLAKPALRECAARALTRNLDDKPISHASWGRVTVSRLPVHAAGATATIGIRIVATLNVPFSEVSVPIYVDVLGFGMGRAEVALTAMSATQPVPATTEQELLALLLARARTHPL
jgi:hypothetical protein